MFERLGAAEKADSLFLVELPFPGFFSFLSFLFLKIYFSLEAPSGGRADEAGSRTLCTEQLLGGERKWSIRERI